MTQKIMDINRETAMRLWSKSFGKETTVTDFAGRTIVKGAYDDRNSEYGWNVDHILPQSKGGATAEHNLICCHIATNDEKANKFPCFKANGNRFEIVKVQNHYEIHSVNKQEHVQKVVDFYDHSSGLKFFSKAVRKSEDEKFTGSILIELYGVKDYAIIDFIDKIFEAENCFAEDIRQSGLFSRLTCEGICVYISISNIPTKNETNDLLDKCILLNTYLCYYFIPKQYIAGYDIYFRMDCFYSSCIEQYEYAKKKFTPRPCRDLPTGNLRISGSGNSLYINDLVIANSYAAKKINQKHCDYYSEYDKVFTQLAKNLDKEVNGK